MSDAVMNMAEIEPLWTGQDMADAMGARPLHGMPEAFFRLEP